MSATPLRLLRALHSLAASGGGPGAGVRSITPVLATRSVATEIVTVDAPGSDHRCPGATAIHALGPSRHANGYCAALRPWLRGELPRFDAAVIHGLWQYHGYALWREARRRGTPYFVYPHGMLDPWFNRTYPLKHLKKRLYWWLAAFRPWRCREVVVNYGCAAPPPPHEAQRAAFRARCPELGDRPFLLFLGRIHEKKGVDLLLQAHAELAAMLEGDAKWGAFRAAEAFVLPSHQENFGIAVAEALACGTPALISDQVNIWREVVAAGAALVEPDTADGTHRLLARWAALPTEERMRMRAAAAACFASRFEISRAADSLLGELHRVLAVRPPAVSA